MKRASITEAKNRLSALIERVRQGQSVIIEDRGVPVAQLGPIVTRAAGRDEDRIVRLERLGILRPAIAKPARLLESPPPRTKRPAVLSRAVIDEREEGW
jgi:prevent-host-death family protein